MKNTSSFLRIALASSLGLLFFFTTFFYLNGSTGERITWSLCFGALLTAGMLFIHFLSSGSSLRTFNAVLLSVLMGMLTGKAFSSTIATLASLAKATSPSDGKIILIIEFATFIMGLYLGFMLTYRASAEIAFSIPFFHFQRKGQKRKNLVVETSVLADNRVIDLATSGLLDEQLVVPRFAVKELYTQAEIGDEGSKQKARKAIETLKKLQEIPDLGMRVEEEDFPDIQDPQLKLLRLARSIDANILSSDLTRLQVSNVEETKIINLHALANALKPLMTTGELLRIKVQRFGKEPRQGVGYLDDGTMVVINGGGDYIGETIDTTVLSVKHTTSGRMIFCNVQEETAAETDGEFAYAGSPDDKDRQRYP